jgi:hypothetical protein
MLDIDNLSKEDIYKVMFQQLYVLNWWYFKFEDLIKVNAPEILGSEGFRKLCEDSGALEAKALSKAFDMTVNDIDGFIKLLRFSHWHVFEQFEVEKLTNKSCRMRIIDCSAQRAAKKRGMGHYDCAEITLRCLRGFCRSVNPDAFIRKVFAPPQAVPDGIPETVSCEWMISIEAT